MPEWWTYTLSDFLLFSPRTYYRMIERYNAVLWPGQLAALGLGIALAWLLFRPGRWQARIVSAILMLLWAWVAWAFLWQRYATINWAAAWFAWAFAIEAVLLGGIGVVRQGMSFGAKRGAGGALGMGLFVAAVALYPLVAVVLGRGWRQAEVFGLMPDPTALGTIGLLLMTAGGLRWWALVVPLLWCAVSGATMLAMAAG